MDNFQIDVKAKGLEKFAHQEIHESPEMEALHKRIKQVMKDNDLNKNFKIYIEFLNEKGEECVVKNGPSMDTAEDTIQEEEEVFIFEDEDEYY